jgi:hypothetical protein
MIVQFNWVSFSKTDKENKTSYMGALLYWVSFSKTDTQESVKSIKLLNGSLVELGFIFENGQPNQDFDTWESRCTGFHFPKRTPENPTSFDTWETSCIGFHFPKRTLKNPIHESRVFCVFTVRSLKLFHFPKRRTRT